MILPLAVLAALATLLVVSLFVALIWMSWLFERNDRQ